MNAVALDGLPIGECTRNPERWTSAADEDAKTICRCARGAGHAHARRRTAQGRGTLGRRRHPRGRSRPGPRAAPIARPRRTQRLPGARVVGSSWSPCSRLPERRRPRCRSIEGAAAGAAHRAPTRRRRSRGRSGIAEGTAVVGQATVPDMPRVPPQNSRRERPLAERRDDGTVTRAADAPRRRLTHFHRDGDL